MGGEKFGQDRRENMYNFCTPYSDDMEGSDSRMQDKAQAEWVFVSEHKVQRRAPRVGLSLSFKDGALTTFSSDQSATLELHLTW